MALYTNIPQNALHASVLHALTSLDPSNNVPANLITPVLNMVLKGNLFQYRSAYYRQLNGIAMGTNAAVQLADTFLDFYFDQRFNTIPGVLWFARYIDDVVAIVTWPPDYDMSWLDDMVPGISWTVATETPLPVLDLSLSLIGNDEGLIAHSDLYQKPINVYGYLPWHSAHDRAVFRGFVKAECQRFARACSAKSDFDISLSLFRRRLCARGYPRAWVLHATSRVNHGDRTAQLETACLRLLDRRRLGREAANRLQRQQLQRQNAQYIHAAVVPFTWDTTLRHLRHVVGSLQESEWASSHGLRFVVALRKAPSIQRLVCRSALTPEQIQLLVQNDAHSLAPSEHDTLAL
jgi:hypothetical protein